MNVTENVSVVRVKLFAVAPMMDGNDNLYKTVF